MLMVWSVDMAYSQSCWVLDRIFHIDITTINEKRLIAAANRRARDNILHICTHFSNLIKVSERVVVRHAAGDALLEVLPLLEELLPQEVLLEELPLLLVEQLVEVYLFG